MMPTKRERRHILPLISLLLMMMFTFLVFNQSAMARTGKIYQAKFLKFIVPDGFSFLDKREFTDPNGKAYMVIFADIKDGGVLSITSLDGKEETTDRSAIKVEIANYVKGVLDELKLDYELSDVMESVQEQTINDHKAFTLKYPFKNKGVLILFTFNKAGKLHFLSYLKVRDASPDNGEAVTTSVMNSLE